MSENNNEKKIPRNKLKTEVYKILEGIVGPERISEDRAIVESYSKFTIDAEGYLKKHRKDGSHIPACIILPESTEEIQSIVKVLNRYKVPFVPFTNGQSLSSPSTCEATVCIHLSRMDKILDIDEHNKTITVQPYVDYSMVNTEAMKKGLWSGGTPGSGSVCKIASHFAFAGIWQTDLKYCGMSRNVVSVKMVLPTGEILETGSLSIPNTGNFCEHGPGPDLMGLLRCSLGCLGIVVEITIKLHRWLGPPELKTPTDRPSLISWSDSKYDQVEAPEGYRVFWVEHPDVHGKVDAIYKICHAGIGIGIDPVPDMDLADMCSRTRELADERKKNNFIPGHIFLVVLAGLTSKKQLDYEEKILHQVVSETGGKIISKDYRPELQNALSEYSLDAFRVYNIFRVFRDTMYGMVWIPVANIAYTPKITEYWEDAKNFFGPKAREIAMSKSSFGFVINMGHHMLCEADNAPKPTDPEGLALCLDMLTYGNAKMIKERATGFTTLGLPMEPLTSFFPEVGPNFNLLLRKIRGVFDPNGVSAPGRQVFTEGEFKALPPEISENMNKIRTTVGLKPIEK